MDPRAGAVGSLTGRAADAQAKTTLSTESVGYERTVPSVASQHYTAQRRLSLDPPMAWV